MDNGAEERNSLLFLYVLHEASQFVLCLLLFQFFQFMLQFFFRGQGFFNLFRNLFRLAFQQFCCPGKKFPILLHHFIGCLAGDRFDTADTGTDAPFADETEGTEFAGIPYMAAAAEFLAESRNGDNPYDVAVFFTEQGHGAGFFCFFQRHFRNIHIGGFNDFIIHDLFHRSHLFGAERFRPGEIETELVRKNQGTGLVDLVAQDPAQCCLEHMGARVVSCQVFPAGTVYGNFYRFPFPDDPFGYGADDVDNAVRKLLRIFHGNHAFFAGNGAGVADLAAPFCMERVVFKNHGHFGAISGFTDFLTVLAEEEELRFSVFVFGGQFGSVQFRGIRRSHFCGNLGPCCPGSFLLFRHGSFEALFIDGHALFLGDFIGQFPGETVGIIELEYLVSGEDGILFLFAVFQHFGQEVGTCIQGCMEPVFFHAGYLLNESLFIHQFRIGRFHHVDNHVDHLSHECILDAQKLAEADSPAENTAEHVAPAFIGRKDAIGNHIRNSPGVVGNNLQCHIALGTLAIGYTGKGCCFFDNREEQVRFKVVLLVLQYCCQTFQTGAGIDVLLGQRQVGAVFLTVVLGEYEVPDFQEPVSVTAHLVFRVRAEFFALVVENFGVRSAGAFTDFPEVIAQRINMVFRESDHLVPVIVGFMVIGINGDVEPGFIQPDHFRQEFPGPGNGFFLEVIAEGEVPQHFKESVVPGGVPYVFNITGTNAFLAGGDPVTGWFHLACKVWLQRCHAGADEKQTGVILRNQRKTLQSQMAFLIFKK